MKKFLFYFLTFAFLLTLVGCTAPGTKNSTGDNPKGAITIVDDQGKTINMQEPARRIISLYSAHTENLFALGLDEEIIGVGKADSHPPRVITKDIYDYRSDPEKVIAVDPDMVLIRPFIARSSPDFVRALENAGINVVCLYPDTFDDFAPYINNLARLTGREKEAETLINDFTRKLKEIKNITKNIEDKKGVFFESTEREYRTITNDCMAANAIRIAGGANVATDARPIKEGSSIASYGLERILARADEIDVYVAQKGAMNPGGTPHAIRNRPGFDTIKAIRDDKIHNIDEKLVSSPTFRFATGVHEMARFFYPEIFDDLSKFKTDAAITRQEMAEITVKHKHKPVFTANAKYYKEHYHERHEKHVYGGFADVPVNHPYFNYIETAVLSGYIHCEDRKMFYPEKQVTRDELAHIIFTLFDVKDNPATIEIKDIAHCKNADIIKIICQSNIMDLDQEANFRPQAHVSGNDVLASLERAEMLFR